MSLLFRRHALVARVTEFDDVVIGGKRWFSLAVGQALSPTGSLFYANSEPVRGRMFL